MKPADFDFISKLVKERSGLVLTPEKAYLIESRLAPIARAEGMGGVEDVVQALRLQRGALSDKVVDAMTTNETFFYRDKTPFETLEQVVLPDLVARKRGQPIKIWCAAASTGQEPYTIAMVCDAMGHKLGGSRVEIVATDISERCLEKARAGIYSQFEVQRGLPVQMLLKHFKKSGENWQISEQIRGAVRYRAMNLLDDFRALGSFDVIFCRNVLIYFDVPTKKRVLERMASQVTSPGFLLLGAAETVLGITDQFKTVPNQRGLYSKEPVPVSGRAAA